MLGLPDQTRAVLFDLDGVLTDTASVHKKAWKAMFDDFLRRRADRSGEDFVGFDVDADYLDYVDGKRREDGVRSFLASRDIRLPEGDPGDGPDTLLAWMIDTMPKGRQHSSVTRIPHTKLLLGCCVGIPPPCGAP